jgi:hypothetical protein
MKDKIPYGLIKNGEIQSPAVKRLSMGQFNSLVTLLQDGKLTAKNRSDILINLSSNDLKLRFLLYNLPFAVNDIDLYRAESLVRSGTRVPSLRTRMNIDIFLDSSAHFLQDILLMDLDKSIKLQFMLFYFNTCWYYVRPTDESLFNFLISFLSGPIRDIPLKLVISTEIQSSFWLRIKHHFTDTGTYDDRLLSFRIKKKSDELFREYAEYLQAFFTARVNTDIILSDSILETMAQNLNEKLINERNFLVLNLKVLAEFFFTAADRLVAYATFATLVSND